MDLRVIERACAEQGGHCNDKAIGGVDKPVAAAGGGLTAARCAAWCERAATAGAYAWRPYWRCGGCGGWFIVLLAIVGEMPQLMLSD